jgi:lysozyme family protein
MTAPQFSALQSEYKTLWAGLKVNPAKLATIDALAADRVSGKGRYKLVETATSVPWFVVALIHQMEAGGSWQGHLHNGDPLSSRTIHVPANRPKVGTPPFTWVESAIDAMRYEGLDKVRGWTIERVCYELEAYNGWGSRARGIHTPYLWSYSNWYTKGKYIADHVWSESTVSAQCGAMPLLSRMMTKDATIAPYIEGKTAPFPPPPDIPAPKPESVKTSWLSALLSIFKRNA